MVQFKALASSSIVHHINFYSCDHIPASACDCTLPNRSSLYTWVHNSPPIRIPPFAGFHIGGNTDNQYVFLEVRYKKPLSSPDYSTGIDITRKRRPYTAGIISPMGLGTIPPFQKQFLMDNCPIFKGRHPIVPFGFQPHAHTLGKLNSAYIFNKQNGLITELGRGNPLHPDSYYVLKASALNNIYINPGDTIMVRCLYDSSNLSTPRNTNELPATPGGNEMCFMNILYYAEPGISTKDPFIHGECTQDQRKSFPEDSTRLLPENRILSQYAMHGNGTGIVHITDDISVNLDMEDFSSVRLMDVKKPKVDQQRSYRRN